jgi:nicotinate-nucleotide adenylyltransferase
LQRLDTWRDWRSLLTLAHIACANRAGTPHDLSPDLEEYLQLHRGSVQDLHLLAAGRIVEFAMVPVDCSATDLRAWLGTGAIERARPCLPEPLIPYLRAQRIYAEPHGH